MKPKPPIPDPLHPVFRALRNERQTLVLSRMGADIAAHLCPNDEEVNRDQAQAAAALKAWDEAHAEEWNRVKPWYEVALKEGDKAHE